MQISGIANFCVISTLVFEGGRISTHVDPMPTHRMHL